MFTILRGKSFACSIHNGYEGLDELKDFANSNPTDSAKIAWSVLLSKGDPGRDDYALCTDLFRILEVAIGRSQVSEQVLHHWPNLDDQRRLNMLAAIDSGVLDTEAVEVLFYSPNNSTNLRHLIVATLASNRFDEAKSTIRKLVGDIGNYASVEKQEILDGFLESIMNAE